MRPLDRCFCPCSRQKTFAISTRSHLDNCPAKDVTPSGFKETVMGINVTELPLVGG